MAKLPDKLFFGGSGKFSAIFLIYGVCSRKPSQGRKEGLLIYLCSFFYKVRKNGEEILLNNVKTFICFACKYLYSLLNNSYFRLFN
jgi:hypothetical protein